MEDHSLTKQIGVKLKKLRLENRLSLDQLSTRCSVSKPMLAQIERGASNPTVNTLWKIANGLGVSFTAFIDEEQPVIKKVNRNEIEPLIEESGKMKVIPLYPMEPGKSFETFYIELEPGCDYHSNPHPEGVEEYLFVEEGAISLEVETQSYTVSNGESLRFTANYPHCYRNESESSCKAMMIIHYPTSFY
ncbi:helix-turn-helix domain-containing protein [Pseudalkalibacillus hwajinpoensis]|uniref:Helix-turn-helix domain-containing protein n=1 Tax=Guptibacillus hwajinpoensis TaxID=208199 RepID=A0A4U1MDE8_9BACL|nr:XRE family transcriptional regulator [Pseudalkalibacillus hwajinpoensis]TKD68747.1 helix-turn-helix domain-containing protein [Pseudalkalibacillus hwajinpoensis]